MKIDAHHHLWTYSAKEYPWISTGSPLHGDFGASELRAHLAANGCDASVAVQARQTVEETGWLCDLADAAGSQIAAVVGWVPLADDSVGDLLAELSHRPKLRGVRHVVQDEPDGFLLADAFNAGVARLKDHNLVYDILVFGRQLAESVQFIDRHPEQPFILDHIAKPTIRAAEYDADWDRHFRELAKRPNVTCKWSGVATEVKDDNWSIDTVRPYWDAAWEAFGPDRLMFGSDWPVALLATESDRWADVTGELAAGLSDVESEAFWGGAAASAYGVPVA